MWQSGYSDSNVGTSPELMHQSVGGGGGEKLTELTNR